MKIKNIVIITILLFISIQLYSQKSSLQFGFGMHQDVHFGSNHVIDSILIGPNSIKDDYRPIGIISYQKRFKDKFEIEIGLSYSMTYHSYIVGLYNPVFNSFIKKVGISRAHTFIIPININIPLTNKLYVKAGLAASLGILDSNNQVTFDNSPTLDNIYNSMQNIYNSNSINYGFGFGYKVRRFDIVFFRKVSFGKVTKPINVNNKEYEIFGKFYSNTISLFYNFILKK